MIIKSSSTLEIVRAYPHDEGSSYAFPREILANSMMSMTRDDTNDVAILKQAGMRLAYPSRFASASGQNGTEG